MESTVFDTALIFEGGGMRAAYSAGMVNTLLENHVYFDNVYGVSAGASHTVNYLSRDVVRTKRSFVDFAADPKFGNIVTQMIGAGLFNAHYIYEEAGLMAGSLPFDYASFEANPAKATIAGMCGETGEMVYWTRDDMRTLHDMMRLVRASSTLPVVMPPVEMDGKHYFDGGLGVGGGIPLEKVKEDGFEKWLIVRTRPKGFRREESPKGLKAMKVSLHEYPAVYEELTHRTQRYNDVCDEIEAAVKAGNAYCVYADTVDISNHEKHVDKLQLNYNRGYEQAQREFDSVAKFLGL